MYFGEPDETSFHKYLNISLWNVVYGLTHPCHMHTLWLCFQLPNNCLVLGCDPLKNPKTQASKALKLVQRCAQSLTSAGRVKQMRSSSCWFQHTVPQTQNTSSPVRAEVTALSQRKPGSVISSAVVTWLCRMETISVTILLQSVFKCKSKPKVKNRRGYLW